jgi:hypothetical protein
VMCLAFVKLKNKDFGILTLLIAIHKYLLRKMYDCYSLYEHILELLLYDREINAIIIGSAVILKYRLWIKSG